MKKMRSMEHWVDYGVNTPALKAVVQQHVRVMRIEKNRDDEWDRLRQLVVGLSPEDQKRYLSLTGGITGEDPH